MIKNYKQFNESLKDKLVGPTEEEILDNLKELSPNRLLIKSCKIGFLKGVEVSLEKGANVHCVREQPLCLSSSYGYIEIVKLLLDKGADIHVDNDYPLVYSSKYGKTDVVKLLLDRGANVHAQNDKSLKMAIERDNIETVKLLKKYMNKDGK